MQTTPRKVSPPSSARNTGYRREPLWLAAMVHRISGLALACFLPLHFLALGLALDGTLTLDRFLHWTHHPLLKAAETILVALLAIHLLGGVRLLLIENMPWQNGQKQMAFIALVVAVVIGAAYLVRVL